MTWNVKSSLIKCFHPDFQEKEPVKQQLGELRKIGHEPLFLDAIHDDLDGKTPFKNGRKRIDTIKGFIDRNLVQARNPREAVFRNIKREPMKVGLDDEFKIELCKQRYDRHHSEIMLHVLLNSNLQAVARKKEVPFDDPERECGGNWVGLGPKLPRPAAVG